MRTRYTKTEMSRLLGMEPEEFVFRGQCYDMGAGKARKCGLTGKNIRYCFTIHPRNATHPRATIGTGAFLYLRRWNPDLWMELEKGRQWLMLQVEGERRDSLDTNVRTALTATEKLWKKLWDVASKRVTDYTFQTGKKYLPEGLFNLRSMLDRQVPSNISAADLQNWYKLQVAEFELNIKATDSLMSDLKKELAQVAKAKKQPAPTATPVVFEELVFD